MKLIQVRECDGQCCRESPRWPTRDGKSCVYLDSNNRCSVKINSVMLAIAGPSPAFPNRSAAETFKETCDDWPQNSNPKIGQTSECCWQWVEDGD